jgi:hypothetical protein
MTISVLQRYGTRSGTTIELRYTQDITTTPTTSENNNKNLRVTPPKNSIENCFIFFLFQFSGAILAFLLRFIENNHY